MSSNTSSRVADVESLTVMDHVTDSLVAFVERCVPARSVNTALDVGCGTGLVCEKLRAKCYSADFVGFDLCKSLLNVIPPAPT